MNSKIKNNILIISIVTLSALTVIVLVLITGFSKSGSGTGGQSSASNDDVYSSDAVSGEDSEPVIEPEESSLPENGNSSQSAPSDDTGRKITELAGSLVGTPFAENGSTPAGFDNSGFIYYVLRENGYIACPRTTEAQSKMGARVGRDSLKVGDLVFFGNESGDTADFGGIYIGDGKMIACLMPGTAVKEVDITNDFYVSNFFGGISLS